MKPYPFQVADLAKLKRHNYTALLNMGTGSGKTAESLFSHIDSGSDRTLSAPSVTVHPDYLTINTPQWLADRAEVEPKLTRAFRL